MLSYLTVPTSTSKIVETISYVFDNWGAGGLGYLTTMILIGIFSLIVLIFLLKLFNR